MLRKRN